MTSSSKQDIWSVLCSFRDGVIIVWSVSSVFFLLSLVLLVADVTDQEVILVMNLVVFAPAMVSSLAILIKCTNR